MKKERIIIISVVFLFAIITAGVVYNYVFNSAHRNIATEDASMVLSANELHTHFLNDEVSATAKYLDKVLETTGEITSVENNDVTLSNKIQVSFNSEDLPKAQNGASVTIKGRCVGYDELLEMVKIDQALIIYKEN